MRQERFTSKNAHHDILKNVIKEEIPMNYIAKSIFNLQCITQLFFQLVSGKF